MFNAVKSIKNFTFYIYIQSNAVCLQQQGSIFEKHVNTYQRAKPKCSHVLFLCCKIKPLTAMSLMFQAITQDVCPCQPLKN